MYRCVCVCIYIYIYIYADNCYNCYSMYVLYFLLLLYHMTSYVRNQRRGSAAMCWGFRHNFKLRISKFGVWVRRILKRRRWVFLARRLISWRGDFGRLTRRFFQRRGSAAMCWGFRPTLAFVLAELVVYSILYYTILYYTILYHTILSCIILYMGIWLRFHQL